MKPISFETEDAFGARALPALFMDSEEFDQVHGHLTKSELEAVARVQDQFHSKEELREFVKRLRSK